VRIEASDGTEEDLLPDAQSRDRIGRQLDEPGHLLQLTADACVREGSVDVSGRLERQTVRNRLARDSSQIANKNRRVRAGVIIQHVLERASILGIGSALQLEGIGERGVGVRKHDWASEGPRAEDGYARDGSNGRKSRWVDAEYIGGAPTPTRWIWGIGN